jgi:NAD(P)-dependent dehydrogenase (short-subunit alcohol dehydrogenase family)
VAGAPDLASSFRLDGRVAVVIGGSRALGSRMTEALAAAEQNRDVLSDAGRFITGAELVVDGGFGAMTI